VSLEKVTREPRVGGAGLGLFLINEAKVPEDLGLQRIGGNDFVEAMERTASLIEINCPGHVCGDNVVVLPEFSDAIDLNREQDRNSIFLQLPGQRYYRRGTPTVSIKDDTRLSLLGIGEGAGAIAIQPLENRQVSFFLAPIFEDSDLDSPTVSRTKFLRQLNFRMTTVVVMNEATYEPDYDCPIRRGAERSWLGAVGVCATGNDGTGKNQQQSLGWDAYREIGRGRPAAYLSVRLGARPGHNSYHNRCKQCANSSKLGIGFGIR